MLDNIMVGKRIKEARQNKQLKQNDVACKIGVAASTIARYEKGEIEKLKLPVIEAISHCLDVNPAWILGKSESMENVIKMDLTSDEINIITAYRSLPHMQEAVKKLLNVK